MIRGTWDIFPLKMIFFSHIAYPSEKIGYNERHDIFRVHHSGNSNKVIGS